MKKQIKIFLAITIILLSLRCSYLFGQKAGIEKGIKIQSEKTEQEISAFKKDLLWGLIAKHRKNKKLPQLQIDNRLCRFANKRAKEISSNFSHDGFHTRHLFEWCPECFEMGENLSRGFKNENQIFQAWLNSKTHREILEGKYNIGCIGTNKYGGELFVALELGYK